MSSVRRPNRYGVDMRRSDYLRGVRDFLLNRGATDIRLEHGGKHPKMRFRYGIYDLWCLVSWSPSDQNAVQLKINDLRNLLCQYPAPQKVRKSIDCNASIAGVDAAPRAAVVPTGVSWFSDAAALLVQSK